MAARHYAQILDATCGDQSAVDDLRFAVTPEPILSGKFRIHYIPLEDSTYGAQRTLIGVPTGVNAELMFSLSFGVGGATAAVEHYNPNGLHAARTLITFSAGQELTFTFDAVNATVDVLGATSAGVPGVSSSPWTYVDYDGFRLGGSTVLGYESAIARGYVSLPYAVL